MLPWHPRRAGQCIHVQASTTWDLAPAGTHAPIPHPEGSHKHQSLCPDLLDACQRNSAWPM